MKCFGCGFDKYRVCNYYFFRLFGSIEVIYDFLVMFLNIILILN